MSHYDKIKTKLNRFIRKYYVNQLIRGSILFVSAGLLYFLIIAGIEYFFWLPSLGRIILFWTFITVELGLLTKFIFIPLARLLKLSRGIDYWQAGSMIGTHFPEVSDKLTNVLQLHGSNSGDELTWASIDQKSHELEPIPFSMAINFKANSRYLKYLAIPVIIIAVIIATGYNAEFTESAGRIADYNTEYEPPAPFSFQVPGDLTTLQGEDYKLTVRTKGERIPETVNILYDGQSYFLKEEKPGVFSYVFTGPTEDISFQLRGNDVQSLPYKLQVGEVPVINDFQLVLDYPSYTGRADETVNSTGNATVPEGTLIKWKISTRATGNIDFVTQDTTMAFTRDGDRFAFAKAITAPLNYNITTSNRNSKNHESLSYSLKVIKDEYPELELRMKRDSLENKVMHFQGQIADDYGFTSLRLVYYDVNDPSNKSKDNIPLDKGTFDKFFYTFPGNLDLKRGVNYELYFQVTDNDAVNNYKSTRSEVYTMRRPTVEEETQEQMNEQKSTLSEMEKSLRQQETRQKELKQLTQEQIEKNQRQYNDKRKLDDFLEKQRKDKRKMREQYKKLEKNIKETPASDKRTKEELEKRLEMNKEELKRQEELLKQIQEYQKKMSKEELTKKLEETQRNNEKQERNLEQMLEMTKRYYVEQKYSQMTKKLDKLAEKQLQQAKEDGDKNNPEEQEKLNESFKEWEKEMDELQKENENLKDPMDLKEDPKTNDEIKKDQKDAKENLEQGDKPPAKKKQNDAGQKMKQKSQQMQQKMQGMKMDQNKEDAKMLRQILDNLVIFSKEQENLLDQVKGINRNSPMFGARMRAQKELEEAFAHVDDSLFALGMRNPMIGQKINKELTDIGFYLDKSMEQLGEFNIEQGQVSQQYVIKGSNYLANMLSNVLNQMQNAMQIPGMGKPNSQNSGSGFQLPDIIKKQESLSKQGQQGQSGDQGESKTGQGKSPGQGQKGQGGKPTSPGSQGQSGKSGQAGQSGKDGQQSGAQGKPGNQQGGQGKSGSNGSSGNSGKGNQDGEGRPGYRESEEQSAELYRIYKQQQELRKRLENKIQNSGLQQKIDRITEKMKSVERRLLDEGYNRQTQDLMLNIHQDLMKLQDASLKQGQDDKRQSNTNREQFQNDTQETVPSAQKYFSEKEILNRQVIPLQQYYQERVKQYFGNE